MISPKASADETIPIVTPSTGASISSRPSIVKIGLSAQRNAVASPKRASLQCIPAIAAGDDTVSAPATITTIPIQAAAGGSSP